MTITDLFIEAYEWLCRARKKHPDKTSIGKIEKGFDFLGYLFSPQRLSLAKKTVCNFVQSALRLYEQGPLQSRDKRLGEYTKNWLRWTRAGLSGHLNWLSSPCELDFLIPLVEHAGV